MSAYINGPEHFDYLLTASKVMLAEQGVELSTEELTAVGRQLIRRNIRSVKYRYDGEALETLPGPVDKTPLLTYRFAVSPVPLHPIWVLQAVRGYEYQACEDMGWHLSPAQRFCEGLTKLAESHLPPRELELVEAYGHGTQLPRYRLSPEWDEAPTWEVTEELVLKYGGTPRRVLAVTADMPF